MKIQANRPVIGRWDRRRIGQVVVNLLANAIKFGSGRPIDIAVSAIMAAISPTNSANGKGTCGGMPAAICAVSWRTSVLI